MDNYALVKDTQPPLSERGPGDLRVTSQGKIRNLVAYGLRYLEGGAHRTLVISGVGPQTGKAVTVAEIIKRTVTGLGQVTVAAQHTTVEIWMPKVEGLDKLQVERHAPKLTITLTKGQGSQSVNAPTWMTVSDNAGPNIATEHKGTGEKRQSLAAKRKRKTQPMSRDESQ